MSRFIYRMQNILEIKYKLETNAKFLYSLANAKLRVEELKLEALFADIKEYEQEIRNLYTKKLNLHELKRCIESIEIKKIFCKQQIQEVNRAKKNLELARLRMNELTMERKTHEKLKDKEFEEYIRTINQKEMKEIDELVSYTYNKVSR